MKVHDAQSSCSRPAEKQRTGAEKHLSYLFLECQARALELAENRMKKTGEDHLEAWTTSMRQGTGRAQQGQCSEQHFES